ncbi:hypothetical protein E0Z10_g6944 [Xylaria hypoxylon]|uniref:J domain-containing protein n=1 Tax=Xylaria hypoxylon TaxID=37992 RepID=A0A4Z0YTR1_9PEZI|nr:hypothetical protein E0Z10_g6944 [Xylaria hypoxylon]
MSDHYAVLGIQEAATDEEIATAYRRLAMIHHPDRNPDNTVGATERFQKIQLAYEVLSNHSERRRYDTSQNTTFPSEDVYVVDVHSDRYEDNTVYGELIYWANVVGRLWAMHHQSQEQSSSRARARAEAQAQARDRAEEMYRLQEIRKRREREKATMRELRRATREEHQASMMALRNATFDRETQMQKVRWLRAGAVTQNEKFSACLHSGFCAIIRQQKKLKCDACGVRRRMTAFECPHCAHYLCLLCVANFTEKRAEASQ